MNRVLMAVALAGSLVGWARADSTVYKTNLANEAGLTYNNTYSLDLNAQGIDSIAFQAIYSSASYAASTFTDGVKSTGTITVANYAGFTTPAYATNSITISNNAALSAQQGSVSITISSNTYLANNNVDLRLNASHFISNVDYAVGATSATTAANLATAISNRHGGAEWVASSNSGVVVASCSVSGSFCNNYTVVTSSCPGIAFALTVPTNFTGGQDNAYFTLNGNQFTNGIDWNAGATAALTAINIKNSLNSNARVNSTVISSTGTGGVIASTAIAIGTVGNAYTLTASTPAFTLGGAVYSGGVNPSVVWVGGIPVYTSSYTTAGNQFQALTSSQTTAINLVAAITASNSNVVVSTSALGVISATSSGVGAGTNYIWSCSTGGVTWTAVTVGHPARIGGANTAIASSVINIPSHGYTTGIGLMVSTAAGNVPPTGLVNQTTYYAIIQDSNDIKLASSLTNAKAGTSITLTPPGTGGNTVSLTPMPIAGTASVTVQGSNDCVNWTSYPASTATNGLPVMSAVSFGTPYTAASTLWDLGSPNFRCINFTVVAPTAGGMKLQIIGNGKKHGVGYPSVP